MWKPLPALVRVGLGHEGGLDPVLGRDRLDHALEQHGVVAGLERVVDMAQIDLVLPGGVFRDQAVDRDALRHAGVVDLVQQVVEIVQLVDAVDLGGVLALAADRRHRRPRPAVLAALAVDQVELQLHRHHRVQPVVAQALDDIGQDGARIGEEGGAVEVLHRQQHLAGRARQPGHRVERVRDGEAVAVRVAVGEAEAGLFDRFAGDVGGEERAGEGQAVAEDLVERADRDLLAAQDAAHVADQGVDVGDVRKLCAEIAYDVVRCAFMHLVTQLLPRGASSSQPAWKCQAGPSRSGHAGARFRFPPPGGSAMVTRLKREAGSA